MGEKKEKMGREKEPQNIRDLCKQMQVVADKTCTFPVLIFLQDIDNEKWSFCKPRICNFGQTSPALCLLINLLPLICNNCILV